MSTPPLESRPLHDNPFVAVNGHALDNLYSAQWHGFSFMEGSVTINALSPLHARLGETQLRLAMLVALGLPSRAVGAATVTSENTVKTHLWRLYRQLGKDKPANVHRINRSSLPRCMFRAGTLVIEQAAAPLGLSRAEHEVVELVAAGYSNTEIGAARGGSGLTTKAHISRLARNLTWNESALSVRTALSFAAILSGEIEGAVPCPEAADTAYPTDDSRLPESFDINQDSV